MAQRLLRSFFLFFLVLGSFFPADTQSQILNPSKWTTELKKKGEGKYDLVFHLELEPGWHIWSLNPGGDGMQIPPSFTVKKNPDVKLAGKVKEQGHKESTEMDGVDGIVNYFHGKVDYIQSVQVSANTTVKGTYEFQICNESMCLPPKEKDFSFEITDIVTAAAPAEDTTSTAAMPPTEDTAQAAFVANNGGGSATTGNISVAVDNAGTADTGTNPEDSSLWVTLLLCFIGGLASVITPCVFSMVPITVSFFLKQSEKKSQGIRNALYYSFSIIVIFTLIGLVISALLGKNAPNFIATNWIVNLVFFAIFVIFGFSFLGAFEITLPSSWTSKTDSRANTKSFSGIFFMALTLVIVSFSCTGPIVGTLLFNTASQGQFVPALGMVAFSTGLALPFALFAIFPNYLQKLGKAGGWLNAVKVVFGFIELALALKFLSNADLAMGWRLLDREIFLILWIALALLCTFYLLGFIRFSHDSELPRNIFGHHYLTVTRLSFAIVTLSFALYLLPGLWGAPLNGLGAFVPPMGTQDYVSGGGGHAAPVAHAGPGNGAPAPVKYVEAMRIYEPEVVRKYGLVTYFDYDEALAAAEKTGKPVLLDFTGINCVNCRKMETQVWSNPEVMRRLKEDFIIASLYCDYDKETLPESEQYFSKVLDAKVKTVGDRNEDIQATQFGSNSQPFYYFVDSKGNKIVNEGYGYDPNVQKFIAHLDNVLQLYKAGKK